MPIATFHTTMSLDDLTAGTGGAMDWMFVDGEPGPAADDASNSAESWGRRLHPCRPMLCDDEHDPA